MKLAHNLVALAFATGCIGLWVVMRVLAMLHVAHPFPEFNAGGGRLSHGDFEIFCLTHASCLPYFGIPAFAYALIASFCRKVSVESFCLFASVLALIFTVLFFTVAVVCMASWVALYD